MSAQESGYGSGVVGFGFVEGSAGARFAACVDVGSALDKDFGSGALVAVGGGVERSGAPVVVVVVGVDVASGVEEGFDDDGVALPGGPMESSGVFAVSDVG